MNFWKPIDMQTDWVRKTLNKKRLERLAVIMLDLGLVFLAFTPFTSEPLLVFFMSALALMFAGAIAVIDANFEEIKEDDSV
jgi:hypothetical protein